MSVLNETCLHTFLLSSILKDVNFFLHHAIQLPTIAGFPLCSSSSVDSTMARINENDLIFYCQYESIP